MHPKVFNMKSERCLVCMGDVDQGMDLVGWLKGDDIICGKCRKAFERIDVHTNLENIPCHILYTYNDELEDDLYRFKENRDIALAPIFFHLDVERINKRYRGFQIVIMPSNQEKIAMRSFHHMSEMLKAIKLPILDPFYKTKVHKQSLQTFLNRKNIQKIMKIKPGFTFPEAPLLIIDDVITTSATMKWACHLLEGHGYPIEILALSANPLFLEKAKKRKLVESIIAFKNRSDYNRKHKKGW
ncbi:MAG: ComF family protein [Erysipelotrichaceae bacterium]